MSGENYAKMRDVLNKARTALACCTWEDGTDMDGIRALLAEIDAALVAPLRNCDVGTSSEKTDRFMAFCNSHTCADCPCAKIDEDCELTWGQMPYPEGGNDADK